MVDTIALTVRTKFALPALREFEAFITLRDRAAMCFPDNRNEPNPPGDAALEPRDAHRAALHRPCRTV